MILDEQVLGLADDHLVDLAELNALGVSGDFALVKEAGEAFVAMQKAASDDGIDCQIYSGFRSFNAQSSIWEQKWFGERPTLNDAEEQVELHHLSELDKMHAILRFSALPGASRHHWGTDIDVYDARCVNDANYNLKLVPSEYEAGGICANLNAWMMENAEKFEFTRPYAQDRGGIGIEPWHYSYAPLAQKIIQNFPLAALHQQINQYSLAGKQIVLANLDIVYNRYILNNSNRKDAL